MKRQRRRLNVQSLETRKMMAGDVGEPLDSANDFKVEDESQQVALLLPAVQAAREAARDTDSSDTHQYSTGGIYTITVTVIDDDTGQSADTTDAVFASYDAQSNATTHDDYYPIGYGPAIRG